MRKKGRKLLLLLLALVIVAGGVSGYTYHNVHTPEYALDEMAEGIAEGNLSKVGSYVDGDRLVASAYDEGTTLLADHIEALAAQYPADWFFRHDTAFMKQYIAERRNDDLVLIHRALDFYFDPQIAPAGAQDQQAQWLAGEAAKFRDSYTAERQSVTVTGGTAQAVYKITGKDTPYGRLVPSLTVKLDLEEQADGHWKVVRIANADEVFAPIVQGIEDYWTLQGWQ